MHSVLYYSWGDSVEQKEKLAYSVAEAAEALSLSPYAIYRLVRQGKIHATHIGGRIVIAKEELRRILEEGA